MNKDNILASKDLHNGYKAVVMYDEDPESPRLWDNLGIMFCSHDKYRLGDKQFNDGEYNDMHDAARDLIGEDIALIYPLSLYEHSGVKIYIGNKTCKWDSCTVGFIAVTKAKLRQEYNCKRITKDILTKAEKIIRDEVLIYNDYLNNNVYTVGVMDEDGELVEQCGGYYEYHDLTWQQNLDWLLEEAESLSPMAEQLELDIA